MSRDGRQPGLHPWVKIGILIGLLYIFLVAIDLMGGAFKLIGRDHAEGLFSGLTSPFAALAVGILATVLVQSSSMTTALVVTAVGAGQLPLEVAVFTIMGCNIGTTVTNTMVSLGHVRQEAEFRRAFAGATMHDFFNLMAVAIFMPLEMTTGVMRRIASSVSGSLFGEAEGGKFTSPIKQVVKEVSGPIKGLAKDGFDLSPTAAGSLLVVVALVIVFVSLIFITKTMRSLMADKIERSLNRILERSGLLAIAVGALITVSVQSSSITTSLMIPLFAAGILKLENGFPVTLGANIGTTITAFLASLATDVNGLTIAIVHLLFNVGATTLIYPIPAVRRLPIRMALWLADATARNKTFALLYVVVVFVLIPLIGNMLFR